MHYLCGADVEFIARLIQTVVTTRRKFTIRVYNVGPLFSEIDLTEPYIG